MRKLPGRGPLLTVVALAFLCCFCGRATAYGQDEPSLGDVARQTRLQRRRAQASRDGSSSQRVVTNDEIPEHASPERTPASYQQNRYTNYQQPNYADYVKQQILTQKQAIARQEAEIERINSSMQYPANCITQCVQLNENLQQRREQVERMKQTLATMKANLERAQEIARRQGYGGAVYDP